MLEVLSSIMGSITRVPPWSLLLLLLLAGCGAVGNHARINALQDELQSTEFPYDVVPNESHSIAGPNFDLTDVNQRNRIGGLAHIDRDMVEVADSTLA